MKLSTRSSLWILLAALIVLGGAYLRLADLHSAPPGLHYDEAADMLLGRDIAFYGYNPFPVVTAYSGREALFYYLSVPLLRIFGTDIFATRLTSAFLGILAIAATIALGKAMFRRRWLIPLIAGAVLAINGPEVWLSRQGFRTSPQPLLEALALWMLVVALNRARHWQIPAILAGFFGGLTVYVYMAARMFPPWIALILLLIIVVDARSRGRRFVQAAVILAAMAVTAAPIVLFYLQNPAVLLDRLSQVAPGGSTLSLGESVIAHLKMFFLSGDPTLRYNLYPGRPFFDPITGLLLVLGLLVALGWFLRDAKNRRAALLIGLSPLLIAPSVVAVGGFPPSHMRSVAMIPLICFAPALGAEVLLTLLRTSTARRLGYALTAALICVLGLNTWGDYRAWAARADVFYDSHGDYNLAGDWLAHNARADELIFIASEFYEHPTILAHPVDSSRIQWMMADHLLLPPPDRAALYIFPRAVPGNAWSAMLAAGQIAPASLPHGPDGAPAFAAYRFAAGALPRGVPSSPSVSINGVLRPCGMQIGAVQVGKTDFVRLCWEVQRTPSQNDLNPVIAIQDAWGNEVAPRLYPHFEHTDTWRVGEQIFQSIPVTIPAGNPPGEYVVRVQWFSAAKPFNVLPLLAEDNSFAGVAYSPDRLKVTRGSGMEIGVSSGAVAEGLYVLQTPERFTFPAHIEQGDRVQFTMRWYAKRAPGAQPPLTVLAANAGAERILWQGDPVHGTYPMAQWADGETVIDRYAIDLPPDLAPGPSTLIMRLGTTQIFAVPLEISAAVRDFTVPALANRVDLRFGAAIRLVGYEVSPIDGGNIRVKLVWQAQSRPDQDYTVFVHLNNPDGSIFSQRDAQPARPTSRWISNEVFTTSYELPNPTSGYTISVGLYLQETGSRLTIRDAADRLFGDSFEVYRK